MKILFYGETPVIETGAARVDRHILDVIVEMGIEVEMIAMSHPYESPYGHDMIRYPFPITGVSSHEEASKLIADILLTHPDYALFISADAHVPMLTLPAVKPRLTMILAAIDGEVMFPQQVSYMRNVEVPAVYSHYSEAQLARHGIKAHCIPLGCEPDVFYPLSAEERRAYRRKAFDIGDETFLVICANRNQRRKDLPRAMAAFHKFQQRVPDSRLYMHALQEDVGGDLRSQAKFLGLGKEVIFTPPALTIHSGFERPVLNRIYNAADVGISTALGEGWGLTTTEIMSAGTPFIGPANTTFFELLGEQRGYLAKCGGDDLWQIAHGSDDMPRPQTSVTDMAGLLYHVYSHREEAKERAARARRWAEQHTWHAFKEAWKGVLEHEVKFVAPDSAGCTDSSRSMAL